MGALRPSLAWLAVAGVAFVFAPLLPGLYWALEPGLRWPVWRALLANREWPQALLATLASTFLGSALALLMAGAITMRAYPSRLWGRVQQHLAILLALPHAAFAVGLFFLLSPSGWLARLIAPLVGWLAPPTWSVVQDPYGLALALALAFKESWFLLWALGAVLGEQAVARQMILARSLGYSRAQSWRRILWPQLVPRLGWPLAAVFAYGLSVVDMAIILGPGNPPTLAVLIWHWLSDANPELQAQGAAAAIVLLVMLLAMVFGARMLWRLVCRPGWHPDGRRAPPRAPAREPRVSLHLPLYAVGYLVVALLVVWSLAGAWFFPAPWPASLGLETWSGADLGPFLTSFWLAAAVCLITLPISLLWLEWGPARCNSILYIPLVVPAMPLVVGQYAALLRFELDGTASGLVWSHLLWVLPYMVLTLVGPYRAVDARLMTTARALGRSRWQACWQVKWPTLLRPVLAALAVGVAVSIAQYLPTLFAGAGRFATVTTEAVALSAGGRRQVLAVQAVLQVMLPFAAFALAAWLARRVGRRRRGLR